MIVAYLFNRPVSEGSAMGAEKTFADYKGTDRAERQDMIVRRGIRQGDILRVRALSDLGQGAESARIQKMIEGLGVTIEVVPGTSAPKVKGRKPRLKPTPEQKEHICKLYYSPAEIGWVLDRASEIMGGPVDRNNLNYWCGSRSGPRK